MNTKEMRQALREAGKHVPRSNEATIKAYNESFPQKEEITEDISNKTVEITEELVRPTVKLVSSNIYTYVGKGDEPPHKIKFKGVQWFTRGIAVEVKSSILEDVSRNASFVKGKVEMDVYYEQDEEEKKKAENQRGIDRQIQLQADRVNQRG